MTGNADAASVVAAALRSEGVTKRAYSYAMAALDALRSLPVEQRMEAMGMVSFSHNWLDHLYDSAGLSRPSLFCERTPVHHRSSDDGELLAAVLVAAAPHPPLRLLPGAGCAALAVRRLDVRRAVVVAMRAHRNAIGPAQFLKELVGVRFAPKPVGQLDHRHAHSSIIRRGCDSNVAGQTPFSTNRGGSR